MATLTLMRLLIALRAARVRLETDAEGLRVEAPAGLLTDTLRNAICEYRKTLEGLPRPYLTDTGELIVPADALPQYHWQPIADTLRELNAPPNVWRTYARCSGSYETE